MRIEKAGYNLRMKTIILLISIFFISHSARAATFAPTSVEVLYQPTYTMTSGGPTPALGSLGGGIRIGYAMSSHIAFNLGGYYDSFVFGGVAGVNQTMYAARATGDFSFMLAPPVHIYAGADATASFSPPAAFTMTSNRDIGAIGGLKVLFGGGSMKLVVGAEYRYALATSYTYAGGSIINHAVMGTLGLHFGGHQ